MAKIWTRIMEKVLHKKNDLCGLCFMSFKNDRTELDDNVVLNEYEGNEALKVSEISSYVFGVPDLANIMPFNAICLKCATAIIDCYKFIKRSRDNLNSLNCAVDNFTLSLVGSSQNESLFNSLFICVDDDFEATSQYYHSSSSQIYSKSEALNTFKFIADLKGKKVLTDEKQEKSSYINIQQNQSSISLSKKSVKIEQSEESFKCKECLKEFSTGSKLRTHILHIHEPKIFKCSECSRSFSTKSLLNAHLTRSHIDLMCAECGRSFNNINTLRTHEKSHYMKYVCQDCGRVYRNQSTFKNHLNNNICQTVKRHSPADAKFECDYCGRKYTQKITLRVHIQYEHGNKKYIDCKWCKKKFWCQSRLNAHIVKHTKEKNFVCSICNGKFVSKASLLYHTRIHTGEKPYQCDYCEGRFLSASRKQAHIRSHHINDTFECDICHSKFKAKYYLNRHKRTHEVTDKIQKGAYSKSKNIDKIQQAFTKSEVDVMEDDVAVTSLQDNREDDMKTNEQPVKPRIEPMTYLFKENLVQANTSNQFQRLVYNIVESDANLYELQIKNESPEQYGEVKLVVLDDNSKPLYHTFC